MEPPSCTDEPHFTLSHISVGACGTLSLAALALGRCVRRVRIPPRRRPGSATDARSLRPGSNRRAAGPLEAEAADLPSPELLCTSGSSLRLRAARAIRQAQADPDSDARDLRSPVVRTGSSGHRRRPGRDARDVAGSPGRGAGAMDRRDGGPRRPERDVLHRTPDHRVTPAARWWRSPAGSTAAGRCAARSASRPRRVPARRTASSSPGPGRAGAPHARSACSASTPSRSGTGGNAPSSAPATRPACSPSTTPRRRGCSRSRAPSTACSPRPESPTRWTRPPSSPT